MTKEFDKFCDFLLEAFGFGPVLGFVGVSNERGNSYLIARDTQVNHTQLINNGKGDRQAAAFAMRTAFDPISNAAWRYSKHSGLLLFWDIAKTPSQLKEQAKSFIEKQGYKVNGFRDITRDDETYGVAHNFK